MKTIKFLLTSVIFTFLLSNTFLYSSYLNLSLVDNSNFTAMVNNLNYTQQSNVIEINNLPGGQHYVKIMKPSSPGNTWNTVIFEGNIRIPDNCNVYASVDEQGNFLIYKKLYGDVQVVEHQTERCECGCQSCQNCRQRNPDKEYRDREHYDESYRIMNSRDFADFKKLVNDRPFESTKIDMTKSVIDNNLFSVDQVREMLSWFTFESNMLEVAKYAFKSTVDRNNYFKLYDAFAFDSNVTDLDNYIKNFK